MSLSTRELLGLQAPDLVEIDGQKIHPLAAKAFSNLRQRALFDGLDLAIASGYRGFARQQMIWNQKFRGERPLFDAHEQLLDPSHLPPLETLHAILRWSALPGTSRHHWGTDLDIFSPSLKQTNAPLSLTQSQYDAGGAQYPLSQWLAEHLHQYDFFLPYDAYRGGVGREPWHISYRPLAENCLNHLTPQLWLEHITDNELYGYREIQTEIHVLFERYVYNINKE